MAPMGCGREAEDAKDARRRRIQVGCLRDSLE